MNFFVIFKIKFEQDRNKNSRLFEIGSFKQKSGISARRAARFHVF